MSSPTYANIVIKTLPTQESKVDEIAEDVKSQIAKILQIPNNDQWELCDSIPEESLYMIHYTDIANPEIYGKYRGTIVDTKAGIVIRKGLGYTSTVTLDQLPINDQKQYLELTDELNNVHLLDKIMITRGFEATHISVFKHNSKVYHSTNKRINSSKARWGGSKTFLELYYEVGGPLDDYLFDPQTVNSPFVYDFLIVHESLLNVTKLPVGVGFIVSLGVKTMWDQKNNPYPDTTNLSKDFIIATIEGTDKLPLNPKTPVIYTPSTINIETANAHLKYGFYDIQDYNNLDQRLTPGEFVIIYNLDSENNIAKTFKVQSTSYAWRWNVRNNDPNVKHRLYQLSSQANGINGTDLELLIEGFVGEFPVMDKYDDYFCNFNDYINNKLQGEIIESPLIVYPQRFNYLNTDYSKMLETKEQRFQNIFLCLLMSIPLHLQKEYLGYYNQFQNDRYNVISWLKDFAIKGNIPVDETYYRVRNIIQEAKKQAKYQKSLPQQSTKNINFTSLVNKIIYTFIHRERGDSLYRLIKLMNSENIGDEEKYNECLELVKGVEKINI